MAGKMRVTFDSNVWRIIASPNIFPREAAIQFFRKIRQAIIDKRITPCISETIFTLEAIKKQDRKAFLASYKSKIGITEAAQADGTIKISISMGPNLASHPGNNNYLSSHLQDALNIGFKLLRCPPRISGVKNPDIKGNVFLEDNHVPIKHRQDKSCEVAKEIENRGAGISHIKAIGSKYDSANWVDGIRKSPKSEFGNISKAVAEWADGDSLAVHIAYKNDYFCTRDIARSGGQDSVLAERNRKWLKNKYEVVFVTPEELSGKIA